MLYGLALRAVGMMRPSSSRLVPVLRNATNGNAFTNPPKRPHLPANQNRPLHAARTLRPTESRFLRGESHPSRPKVTFPVEESPIRPPKVIFPVEEPQSRPPKVIFPVEKSQSRPPKVIFPVEEPQSRRPKPIFSAKEPHFRRPKSHSSTEECGHGTRYHSLYQ